MPLFEQLQKASFSDSPFPVVSVEVSGGIRDHLHEYPHAAGAAVEKLGRKLYVVKMEGLFHANFPRYPNLWPATLSRLRVLYEDQTTDNLVIPTIGTIRAYCRSWSETMTNKHSSGVSASFEFVEDQEQASLISSLITVNAAPFQQKADNFDAAYAALSDQAKDKTTESLFDSINDLANSILSIGDQVDAYGNLVASKVLGLVSLIDQFDRLAVAQDCRNYPLRNALHDLWDATLTLSQDVQGKRFQTQKYIVPTTMALSAVSQAIYRDTTHTVELMQLNPVEDVFAVRAGTPIVYYPPASNPDTSF